MGCIAGEGSTQRPVQDWNLSKPSVDERCSPSFVPASMKNPFVCRQEINYMIFAGKKYIFPAGWLKIVCHSVVEIKMVV
jgi:hypothetical protein